jgi:hypothetical protein
MCIRRGDGPALARRSARRILHRGGGEGLWSLDPGAGGGHEGSRTDGDARMHRRRSPGSRAPRMRTPNAKRTRGPRTRTTPSPGPPSQPRSAPAPEGSAVPDQRPRGPDRILPRAWGTGAGAAAPERARRCPRAERRVARRRERHHDELNAARRRLLDSGARLRAIAEIEPEYVKLLTREGGGPRDEPRGARHDRGRHRRCDRRPVVPSARRRTLSRGLRCGIPHQAPALGA